MNCSHLYMHEEDVELYTFSFWSTLTLLLVYLVMGRASDLGVFVLGFGFLRGLSFSAEVLQRVNLNVAVWLYNIHFRA